MDMSSIEHFKEKINQIRQYIEGLQYIEDIAGYTAWEKDTEKIKKLLENLQTHYREFKTDRKLFEYKATIISLYGLLEKSVEIWIKEYLEILSNIIPQYANIDTKIKEKHFELSLKLISIITSRESVKYEHLHKEEVLKKLHNCIENHSNYKINTEAFTLLSGNLKHNKIVELFKPVNIKLNEKLIKNETLVRHIQNEKQVQNISSLEKDILYTKINELVERRNEIAHGSDVDNILGHSELEKYIEFLENYCQAIFEILYEEVIKQESIYKFKKIVNGIQIFNNDKLAFEIENCDVKIGDTIIVQTAKGKFFKKPILEIQLNSVPHDKLTIDKKTNICVKLKPKIKENQEFFIKRREI